MSGQQRQVSFEGRVKLSGTIKHKAHVYGQSVAGIPLEVVLPLGPVNRLIFSGIHGEEPESTVLLSKALRLANNPLEHTAVILAANPDGLLKGTRGNANGVDLNRNFPANNWQQEAVCHRWELGGEQCVALSTGSHPGSEPETQALIQLIETLKPEEVIAMHAPLACIDDPDESDLAKWMAQATNMPLVPDVGTPTPGSFGSWCKERELSVITYELPAESIWQMMDKHLNVLTHLLK